MSHFLGKSLLQVVHASQAVKLIVYIALFPGYKCKVSCRAVGHLLSDQLASDLIILI